MSPQDAAYCDKARDLETVATRADPAKDQALALSAFQSAVSALVPVAPDDLKADVITVDQAVQQAATYDDLRRLGSAELQAATDHIDTWTQQHCGFRIGRD